MPDPHEVPLRIRDLAAQLAALQADLARPQGAVRRRAQKAGLAVMGK